MCSRVTRGIRYVFKDVLLNMSPRDIVDVQLDSFFGARFPWKMQALVDNELTMVVGWKGMI